MFKIVLTVRALNFFKYLLLTCSRHLRLSQPSTQIFLELKHIFTGAKIMSNKSQRVKDNFFKKISNKFQFSLNIILIRTFFLVKILTILNINIKNINKF